MPFTSPNGKIDWKPKYKKTNRKYKFNKKHNKYHNMSLKNTDFDYKLHTYNGFDFLVKREDGEIIVIPHRDECYDKSKDKQHAKHCEHGYHCSYRYDACSSALNYFKKNQHRL